MSIRNNNPYSFIHCPECNGELRYKMENNVKTLICASCKAKYLILKKTNIIKMFPQKICPIIKELYITDAKKIISYEEAKESGDWLIKKLGIKKPEKVKWKKGAVYLYNLAHILKICREQKLGERETRILVSLLGAKNMSPKYKETVADPLYASPHASYYELYEEFFLKQQIDALIEEEKDIVIIELGSGVGRVFVEYGLVSTKNISEKAQRYRSFLSPIFDYDPAYSIHLKQMVGVDFSKEMLEEAYKWLENIKLAHLLQDNKIIQIQSIAQLLNMKFPKNLFKVVTILFQTLGNQLGEELQIEMLKKAKEIASPNGMVFVSVFNKEVFEEQAKPYYEDIKKSVGQPIYFGEGIFLSNKGVFSVWFDKKQLKKLFKKAGINDVYIFHDDSLPIFEGLRILPEEIQKKYRKRTIIAIGKV